MDNLIQSCTKLEQLFLGDNLISNIADNVIQFPDYGDLLYFRLSSQISRFLI